MAGPSKLPASEYPAALLAMSDVFLEYGREVEAMLLREIAGWISEMTAGRIPPEVLKWWGQQKLRNIEDPRLLPPDRGVI